MSSRRLLVIALDGFDVELAQRFAAEGLMSNFSRLKDQCAYYDLEQGQDRFSGLTWEHFSSGIAARDGGRWSSVKFHPHTYKTSREESTVVPFFSCLNASTVLFDVPYCDLARAPGVRGLSNWGAHSPGVRTHSSPADLLAEVHSLFGPYPATSWLYALSWTCQERTRQSGEALAQAVNVRARLARWLFGERFPDWQMAMMVVSEGHSAAEALWHGVDSQHPLHGLASAPLALEALRQIYAAIDRLIFDLQESFPDANLMIFSMHGMGTNKSDPQAMALLPELLYRFAFRKPYMRQLSFKRYLSDGTPLLEADQSWERVLLDAVPPVPGRDPSSWSEGEGWMPAERYSPFWSDMPAFALPAFDGGRIRLNVAGREARGIIPSEQYQEWCQEIGALIEGCANPRSGEKVSVKIYQRAARASDVREHDADLHVIWSSPMTAITHPDLGEIGAVPYRRTGGHTGGYGHLFIKGAGIESGARGLAGSFDIVPTIFELLNKRPPANFTGKSLFAGLK